MYTRKRHTILETNSNSVSDNEKMKKTSQSTLDIIGQMAEDIIVFWDVFYLSLS